MKILEILKSGLAENWLGTTGLYEYIDIHYVLSMCVGACAYICEDFICETWIIHVYIAVIYIMFNIYLCQRAFT